ncbi:ABC transporter ATP-binding protein [Streptomyces sp. NBC_00287]|uniref:ABC transporter ATP-binding protein n=1 Tax=Streptomyces sp. NBC_00287 TaxID=2975702 RepID=UPI002E2AE99D|nr:ABC transporter ATP-binding protein [Streptomyces sp. NBC_00287]
MNADPSIVIRQLRREFRIRGGRGRPATQVTALHGLDLEIPHGSVYGLLGPNGAGKTTLTRILATLLVPTSGSAHILGLDVQRDLRAVRKTVAVVFGGDSGLYDRLSARDNLRYFAELYGIPPRIARPRAAELLEQFRLSDVADRPVEGFSRGMRQRLHLARGLLHDPRVVLLDEPTNGIDPVGARELRQVISGLRDAGKTILLTTHYMFEAEELCDRITVMNKGRIVATGTAKELRAAATLGRVAEFEVRGVGDELVEKVKQLPSVRAVDIQDREQLQIMRVHFRAGHDPGGEVAALLGDAVVGAMPLREPTLEDAYVELVSRPVGELT